MKKIIYILSAILALFIVTLTILVNIYLSEDKIRELVITPAEKGTGFTINIEKIDAGIWGGIHVDLENIEIIDPKFTKYQYLLKSDNIRAYVPLSSLWSSEYTMEEFLIENASLNYEVSEEKGEESNVKQVISYEDETKKDSMNLSDISFVLSALSLKNSNISVYFKDLKQELMLSGINQSSSLVLDSSIVDLKTETEIDTIQIFSEQKQLLRSENDNIELNLLFNLKTKNLKISDSKYNLLNIPGNLESDLTIKPKKNGYLKFFGDNVNLEKIISNIDPQLTEKLSETKGILSYLSNVSFDDDKLSFSGNLDLSNGFVEFKDPQAKIERINSKIDFSDKRVSIKETEIIAEGQRFTLAADIEIQEKHFDVNSNLNLKADLSKLKKFNPLLPEKFQLNSGFVQAKLNIKDKVKKKSKALTEKVLPKFSSNVVLSDVSFKTIINKEHTFKLKGSLEASEKELKVRKLSLSDEANSYYISSLSLKNYMNILSENPKKKANLAGNLYSKKLISDHYLANQKDEKASINKKEKKAKKNNLENFAILAKVDMNTNIRVDHFKFENLNLRNIKGSFKNKQQTLSAIIDNLDVYDGSSSGKLSFDYNRIPLNVASNISLKKMDANKALTETAGIKNKIYGSMNAKGKMFFSLDDTLGIMPKTILSELDIAIKNGKIANVEALKKLGKQLKIFKFDTLFLNSWTYGATIRDEVVYLKNTVIKGADFRIISNQGKIGFNKKMNIPLEFIVASKKSKAYIDQSDKLVKKLLPYLRNKDSELELELILLGKVNAPDVKFVWDKARKRLEKDAKKNIEKKAKNFLKKLFN